jgi:hypothetical protein
MKLQPMTDGAITIKFKEEGREEIQTFHITTAKQYLEIWERIRQPKIVIVE